MKTDKSPFTRYREGYLDGYAARDARLPLDTDYLRGFADGTEDDLLGKPNKFEDKK